MVGQFKYGKESAVRFRYKFRLQSVVASHRPYYDACGIFQFGNGQTVSVALYSVGRHHIAGHLLESCLQCTVHVVCYH